MIIEIQMTTHEVSGGIRNVLRSQALCFTKEATLQGETWLLDHLEVTDKTTLGRTPRTAEVTGHEYGPPHFINAYAVKVTQEIVLHFTSISDLQANGAAPTPPSATALVNPAVAVNFILTMVLISGHPQFHAEYFPPADIGDLGVLIPDAGQQIDAALSKFSYDIPLDLSGLGSLELSGLQYVNAGITTDESGSVLSIRLENGTDPDTLDAWTTFFTGGATGLLDGKQWGLFVDHRLLEPIALGYLNAASKNVGGFSSQGSAAAWAGDGHSVNAMQSGVLNGAGPFGSDVDVTLHANSDFLVEESDVLTLRLSFSADANVEGIVGSVLDFLGVELNPSVPSAPNDGWTKIGDSTYEREQNLFLGNELLGHLSVEQVASHPDGLHLLGSTKPAWPVIPAALSATLMPFEWAVRGSCRTGFGINQQGYLGLNNDGSGPLEVCEARVLYDPDNQFPVTIEKATAPLSEFIATVRVDCSVLKPSYLARPAPYPCQILIKTTGGARVVSFGIPTTLTEDARHQLEFEHAYRVVSCIQLVNDFFRDGRLDPKWIPDPAPDEEGLRFWEVYVAGLAEKDEVVLSTRGQQKLFVGVADAFGRAYAWAVTPQTPQGLDVSIHRSASGQQTAALTRSVEARQTPLRLASTLRNLERPMKLRAARYGDLPVIVVVSGRHAVVYDVRNPSRPLSVAVCPIGGLKCSWLKFPKRGARQLVPHGPEAAGLEKLGVIVGNVFACVNDSGENVEIYELR
ncbi:hypothetical protein QFZ94_006625 [Paraburkholderia sp. JPY465]|uniref:hypothetical protein n=1 Tax=Paraburkholderia sp. JPY465 TaxID=3042285 RepID=UPI003D1F01A6